MTIRKSGLMKKQSHNRQKNTRQKTKIITFAIHNERKRQLMTQGELSRITGISQSGLSRIETGERLATVTERRAISQALKVPQYKLFPKLPKPKRSAKK